MKRMQAICGNCGGMGHTTLWRVVEEDPETHICTMDAENVTCEQCGGSGYTEYAVFSIEEAEVILKHCGLEVT